MRAAALALAALVTTAACSGGGRASAQKASDAAPADPATAAMAKLALLEQQALAALAAHTGERYTTDEALAAALRDEVLPRYREFVAGLEEMPAPSGRRGELLAKLRVLAASELRALESLAGAIDRGDGMAVLGFNAEQRRIAEEMETLMKEWNQAGRAERE